MIFDLVKKYVSVYVSGRLLSAAINFLTVIFLVRALSASDYGRYALLFGLGNLLSILFYRCLSQSMLRFYSAYTKEKKQSIRIMSLMFFLLLSMDLIVVLLGVGVYLFLQRDLAYVILVMLMTIVQGHFFVNQSLFQAKIKKYFAVGMMVLKSAINIALVLILISLGWRVYGALSALVIALLVVSVVAWRQCWYQVKPQWDRDLFREVAKYGLMSLMIFGVSYFVGYIDRYLLAFLDGLRSSGVYSAAYDITYQGVNMLLFSVATGIVPLLYRTYENKEHAKFKKIFSANVLLICSVGFYLCLISIVFFHFIAHLIYGQEVVLQAYDLVPLVVVACFFMSFKAYCLDVLFQARKSLYIILMIFVVMLVTNILLNLYLIPKFQIVGAAWAGVISAFIGVSLTFACAQKQFSTMFPWLDLFKLLVCVVVCAVLGVYLFAVQGWVLVIVKFFSLSASFAIACILLNVAEIRKNLVRIKK